MKGALAFLKQAVSNLFSKPVTLMYPDKVREIPERYRGGTFALVVDEETGEDKCIACRLCERICPSQIISIEIEKKKDNRGKTRGFPKKFDLDFSACLQCELCVQVCPEDAIVMIKHNEPAQSRDELYLTLEKLHENWFKWKGKVAWATGERLRKMHEGAGREA